MRFWLAVVIAVLCIAILAAVIVMNAKGFFAGYRNVQHPRRSGDEQDFDRERQKLGLIYILPIIGTVVIVVALIIIGRTVS
jgi:heme exporter protein D